MSTILWLSPLLLSAQAQEPEAIDEAEETEEVWDIEAAHGPTYTWSQSLDEGTWMSVDVHPDGRRLVFDLLGDLFELPLRGGEATPLSTGVAWDQDPRWSPDGNRLLFVSDRGGNQEIWIRDMETGEDEVLTEGAPERFAEASWSPDGRFVVARKRITDTRSIGMCELWLFDTEGGDGIQLTETSDHPFPTEATFSNDGRYLYFSSTPWRFQYGRNPHHGIYDLHRMEFETGEVIRLTAEAGSSFRPTVRPGTGEIALFRRSGTDTVLEILDPVTGTRRLLAEGFARDNQEGFALNGLYPHSSWTPNGRELVTWSDGGLVRVQVRNGEKREIPFTANVEHTLTGMLRTARRVEDGEQVTARLVRWPSVSPDGRTVLFEALGRLWTQRVGEEEARPITDGGVRPLFPSWSPDGRRILYASWDDEDFGQVRILDPTNRRETRISSVPAQYLSPTWSPDGSQVAWLRGSGAPGRGHEPASELWLRLEYAPANGRGVATEVMHFGHAWGRAPTLAWSADSSRFLLVDSESASEPHHADTTVLKSVNLEGRDERRLAHWSRAQRVSISPDGTRVGWVEDFRVYSATLPVRGGITLELGAETEPVPVTEHAETAGDWLAWTGDTLSHAHGPTIEWGEETLALSASLDRPVPLGSIAYTNVRVVTMGDQGVLENATVVVSGERIRSVGSQPPPPGARVIDATGKTLIPGLIDVHAHLHFGGDTQPQRSWKHEINLAYGVTSVHDPSAFNDTVFATAERIRAGLQLGPRVWSTGGVLYGAKGRYNSQIESLEDARFHVARQAELGAFSIKSYQQPSRRQRQWLIAAARDAGINVYPEGGGDLFHNMSMLVDGHTGIEHALPVAPLYADVRGLYAASGAGYTPTLLVAYGGLSGEHWFFQTEALLEDEKFLRFAPEEWVARNLRRRSVLVSDDDWFFREVAQAAAVLQDEGVPVLTGAHGQVQGVGVHWEMWALGGAMGPLNALRTATLDAAWYIGVEQDLGSIEVGKLADMVLIDGNPLEDLRLSVEIVEVMQGGTRFNAETLDEL